MREPVKHVQGAGHPWDQRPGFDLLVVEASTEAERDEYVRRAEKKFWKAWIVGFSAEPQTPGDFSLDRPSAVLYKPSGLQAPWSDSPDAPHPGCRDGVEISTEELVAWRLAKRRSPQVPAACGEEEVECAESDVITRQRG